ncbi:MAG: hypothetical protein K0S39_4521 [Paenibacillus sp.]|jgi:hypothetical protein|nr:hypothetical protein [Paenibacillus sp.]
MKKITLILSIALATISWTGTPVLAEAFTDIPPTSSYLPYIENLKKLDVVDGIGQGLFGPEQTLTRAQLAKFLAAAFQLKDNGNPVPFTDIQEHWAAPYIRAAYQAGITDGTSDAIFSPDKPVKRQEASAMVWRYAKKSGLSPGPALNFREKPDNWAVEATSSVIAQGWYGADVLHTDEVWSYRPQELMTRQEMATLLDLSMKTVPGSLNKTAAAAGKPKYNATWLWNSDSLLPKKDEVLQFLQQNKINLIFLQIDPDMSANEYGDFISKAGTLGIEVHALGGAPNWILPENQIKMYKLIDWVKNYNNKAQADQQFKGIHLDVEPFVMPVWYQNTDTMLGLWRDTVSGFVEEIKKDSPHLIAGADLPVWLERFNVTDGHGERTTLSDWMIEELDQTTLMAYRDNSNDILSSVANEMDEAEKYGKSIIVSVETKPSNEGPITFYDKGQTLMMQELGRVVNALQNRASFVGYAIHEYESWITLKN